MIKMGDTAMANNMEPWTPKRWQSEFVKALARIAVYETGNAWYSTGRCSFTQVAHAPLLYIAKRYELPITCKAWRHAISKFHIIRAHRQSGTIAYTLGELLSGTLGPRREMVRLHAVAASLYMWAGDNFSMESCYCPTATYKLPALFASYFNRGFANLGRRHLFYSGLGEERFYDALVNARTPEEIARFKEQFKDYGWADSPYQNGVGDQDDEYDD